MLTAGVTEVDAQAPRTSEPPRAVMWTVSRIAARDGVSKQAVSKKVGKLLADGLTVEQNGRGQVTAVNVAEYDRLRGRTDDPSKVQAPIRAAPREPEEDSESYNEAARQTKWIEAERRRLELAELKGELIRVSKVADAVVAAGQAIAKICDRLPNAADDLSGAHSRAGGGMHAVRVALKELARRQRAEIADVLAAIAAGAPKDDIDTAEQVQS